MALEEGDLVHNRYRIVETLGKGGMGAVYRATDESLGVSVALKENLFAHDEFIRQFRREALILAELRHTNLPRVTDHFVYEGQGQYLVMDYIEGEDLQQRRERLGTIAEDETIVIAIAICDALHYLHTRPTPILHRDIKPGNIKVTLTGAVYLVDFGLAKLVVGQKETTAGARGITPGFSPPEQYGTGSTDVRSDIYALGATLYAVLTGSLPEDALGRAMAKHELTPVTSRIPSVSNRLAAIIEKAMEVQPEDRFQTTEEMRRELLAISTAAREQIQSGEMTITPPPLPDELQTVKGAAYSAATAMAAAPTALGSAAAVDAAAVPVKRSGLSKVFIGLGIIAALAIVAGVAVIALSSDIRERLFGGGAVAVATSPSAPTATLPLGTATGIVPSPAATDVIAAVTVVPADPTQAESVAPGETNTPEHTPTPLTTPMGGGEQIAFASDRTGSIQIWLVNTDGSNLEQLTNVPDGACQPDWSPDGERLVFISPCKRNQERYPNSSMFVINADGSGLVTLPTSPGGDYDPAWSPDGNRIAFTSLRNNNRPYLYILDLISNEVIALSSGVVRDFQPTWSPDGDSIAFTTIRADIYQIWLLGFTDEEATVFTRSADQMNTNPIWSPLDDVILFTQSRPTGGVPWIIAATIESNGIEEYRLTSDPMPMREAEFSPDGFWITFESWPDGVNHDVYIMNSGGSNIRQLTTDPAYDFDPTWRPGSH